MPVVDHPAIFLKHTVARVIEFHPVLAGIGIGAELVVIDTYVSEMVPSRARGRYVAITQLIGFTAIPVAALLARILVPTHWLMNGWRWVMVIGATGALFTWYLRRSLPESPRWLESRGRGEKAERLISWRRALSGSLTGEPSLAPSVRGLLSKYAITPAMLEEIIIAVLAVYLILMHLRSAFVICVTLPLSVLFSFLLMWLLRRLGVVA